MNTRRRVVGSLAASAALLGCHDWGKVIAIPTPPPLSNFTPAPGFSVSGVFSNGQSITITRQ